MKKITSLLLTIFILLSVASLSVNAADGITAEKTNEDLSLSVSLEKTEFLYYEKINIDLLVKNISEKSLFQHLNSGPADYLWRINREIIAEDGTVYGPQYFKTYGSGAATGATTIRELFPKTVVEDDLYLSESENKIYVLGNTLPTGNYKLRAWVEYTDHFEHNKDEIDVSYNTKSLETVVDFSVKDTIDPTTEPTTTEPTTDPMTTFPNGITLSIEFEKSEYLVGEEIVGRLILKNNTNKNLRYYYGLVPNIHYRNQPFFLSLPYKEEGSYFVGGNPLSKPYTLPWVEPNVIEAGKGKDVKFVFSGKYVTPNGEYVGDEKLPQTGVYSGSLTLTNFTFREGDIDLSAYNNSLSVDFTVNIVDELSENANTPKVFSVTKMPEEFDLVEPPMTTLPLDLSDQPTQNAPTQNTELDLVHPTATAPNGFYNSNPVPNPPTDSGSIPAVTLALIGASVLIVCSKKKK